MKVPRICENTHCRQLFDTDHPEQRFCSRACTLEALGSPLTPAGRAKGGIRSAVVRRERALERLEGKDPIEIFRIGYQQGYNQGQRRKPRKVGTPEAAA